MPDFSDKVHPRNLAALRTDPSAPVRVAGNPVSSLLQSGVGNCFPGLECDLRNLERRFFPFLEVDTDFETILISGVDRAGVDAAEQSGEISAAAARTYRAITPASRLDDPQRWVITRLRGDFGPLGPLDFALADLTEESFGAGRLPVDSWTALRLLREDAVVRITLQPPAGAARTLSGRRARYLDANGALSRLFEVGELAQSLCSPWTHDFRDCGCYYWATNHPDIALPPTTGAAPQPADNLSTDWLRRDRSLTSPPVATAVSGTIEPIRYHEINRNWQLLNPVLERREQLQPYAERPPNAIAQPLPDRDTLLSHLRYAAGVELAVMQEYLAAAWSLQLPAAVQEPLRSSLRAAKAEIVRIAIGEMRHLRAVNDVLRALAAPGTFQPALRPAAQIPIGGGQFRPKVFRALTAAALDEFIAIEAPSDAVDSFYSPILASLPQFGGSDDNVASIRKVMAEGEDHWQAFLFIREWLQPMAGANQLRAQQSAAPGLAQQVELQARYVALLQTLHAGYLQGLPGGASTINSARSAMLGGAGIQGALEAVAVLGFVPVFSPVNDPRFSDLQPPP